MPPRFFRPKKKAEGDALAPGKADVPCPVCKKKFRSTNDLKQHLRTKKDTAHVAYRNAGGGGGGAADGEWEDVPEEEGGGHPGGGATPLIFPEDVVSLAGKPGHMGVVLNVADVSDSESEPEDYEEHLPPDGHARVQWMLRGGGGGGGTAHVAADPEPKLEKLTRLSLVDRAFLHGDVVSRVADPVHGESGTVVGSSIAADVSRCVNGELLRGIPADALRRTFSFAPGQLAVRPSRRTLCRTLDCRLAVRVRFAENGAQCVVRGVSPGEIEDELQLLEQQSLAEYEGEPPYFSMARVAAPASFWRGASDAPGTEGVTIEWLGTGGGAAAAAAAGAGAAAADRSRCLLPRDPNGKRYGKHARVKALVMSVETYSVSVEPVAHADTGGLPAD